MQTTYNGWPLEVLQNEWLNLVIAPELGGRLLQLTMGGYDYLFVNPRIAGFQADHTRLDENGNWLNYGGEKIWPAPQGWQSDHQWPGPPDPILDGGIYQHAYFQTEEGNPGLTLRSPVDTYTGLQVSRKIWLSESRAEILVHVTFTNRSDRARRWSVWPVCQVNVPTLDTACHVVCPVNPNSRFPEGYKVMHGLVNSPQYRLDKKRHLVVEYQYLVGKVGLDAAAGWVAFVNCAGGNVLIMRYDYEEGKPYPDETSVHIWTQGRGLIYSRNRLVEFANDKILNPPYMEMELLSPLQEIAPGDQTHFAYRLLTSTVPIGEAIWAVNEVGIVACPLTVAPSKEAITIRGKYGVFGKGTLRLRLTKKTAVTEITAVLGEWPVSPTEGLAINLNLPVDDFLPTSRMILDVHVLDEVGQVIGRLDELVLKSAL